MSFMGYYKVIIALTIATKRDYQKQCSITPVKLSGARLKVSEM